MSGPGPGTEKVGALLLAQRERFRGYLTRRTGSATLAEDILQSAYLRALERGAPDVPDEGVVAWFHGVLKNAWLDQLRRRGAEGRALGRLASELGDGALDPELRAQVCACMDALVPELPPSYAEVLRAVDLEERPVAEVAQAAGITVNNAHVRLHRARQALRRELARTCGACADHGCLDCGCSGKAARPEAGPRGLDPSP